MCSIVTHPVVPLALSACFPDGAVSHQLLFAGAMCSIVSDADVLGFSAGISYGDMLGHRGLTHSVAFAAALSTVIALLFRHQADYGLTLLFLFLSTLSHPLLDMLTNGGLGVALWAPFSNERFFFPWRPIAVSPLGFAFFSPRGAMVFLSELRWVWLPAGGLFFLANVLRRYVGAS